MNEDRAASIERLLIGAEAAHAEYEATKLNGVYDQEWPAWYARHAVDHGLGEILGRPVDAEELGAFFTRTWDEVRQADSKPVEPWSTWMARRIAAEL